MLNNCVFCNAFQPLFNHFRFGKEHTYLLHGRYKVETVAEALIGYNLDGHIILPTASSPPFTTG